MFFWGVLKQLVVLGAWLLYKGTENQHQRAKGYHWASKITLKPKPLTAQARQPASSTSACKREPQHRFRVQGSGFRVWGLGFRVQGSGFRV